MKPQHRISLDKILNDTVSGSSELTSKLNDYFLKHCDNVPLLKESIRIASSKLKHFAAVNNYLQSLIRLMNVGTNQDLKRYLQTFEKGEFLKFLTIAKKFKTKFKNINTILTISRSGTLLNVLRILSENNDKLKVLVSESRPIFEGRLTAKSLLKAGIKVEMITEAMSGLYIQKCDAAVIGADKILANSNVINKSGSLSLALLCKEFNKPFVVVSTSSKFSNEKKFIAKYENSSEVWRYKHPKLTVSNIYFEEIDKRLITEIITE